MAGTRTLGANFETADGGLHLHNNLVKTERTLLSIVSGTAVYSFDITVSGNAKRIKLEMPSITGANPTAKLTIENSDSEEIYESPSTVMAENDDHVMVTSVPLVGTNTIKLTLSTDPLSSATAYVTIYLEGGN